MATILEQSDIDRTFMAHKAIEKIQNNYYELLGIINVYDLTKKRELKMCLEDIIKTPCKTKDQIEFMTQCKYILGKLSKG